jgi:hypothetical protein
VDTKGDRMMQSVIIGIRVPLSPISYKSFRIRGACLYLSFAFVFLLQKYFGGLPVQLATLWYKVLC